MSKATIYSAMMTTAFNYETEICCDSLEIVL